jgi:hypothetical protein
MVLMTVMTVTAIGGKVYPNEKWIVGKWKPVKVEKVASVKEGKQIVTKDTIISRPVIGNIDAPGINKVDKLMMMEQKTMLEITGDRTAMKDYHGTIIKATFKLKKGGTKIVARNIKTKERYVFNIVEATDSKLVLIEKTQGGLLKITYVKQ